MSGKKSKNEVKLEKAKKLRIQKNKSRYIAAIICSVVLIITSICCYITVFIGGATGNMEDRGFAVLRYFTLESNVLLTIVCIIMLPYLFKALKLGKIPAPGILRYFKFAITQATTITFLVSACFLTSIYGIGAMFDDENLFMHLINPLIGIALLLFLENDNPMPKKTVFFGTLPVLLYGSVYYIQVIVRGTWKDFYGFNQNGKWYISIIAMEIANVAVSLILWKVTNVIAINRKKRK